MCITYFMFHSITHDIYARSRELLSTHKHRNKLFKRLFSYHIVQTYNELPEYKDCSLRLFKNERFAIWLFISFCQGSVENQLSKKQILCKTIYFVIVYQLSKFSEFANDIHLKTNVSPLYLGVALFCVNKHLISAYPYSSYFTFLRCNRFMSHLVIVIIKKTFEVICDSTV